MKIKEMLEAQGFLPVALPNSEIQPLQILQKSKGALKRLNDTLMSLFESSRVGAPPIRKNVVVPNVNGTFVVKSDFNASLSFLTGLKDIIGMDLGAKFKYNDEDQLVFAFENPTLDEINTFGELHDFLYNSTLKGNDFAQQLLDDEFYVITAVLKSTKFSVGIVNSPSISAGIDLPNIKDLIESELTYDHSTNEKRGMVYEGETPLVFGVQAARIFYDKPFLSGAFGGKGKFRIKDVQGIIVRSSEKTKITLLKGENNLTI